MAVPEVTSLRGKLARRGELLMETTAGTSQRATEQFMEFLADELLLKVIVESLQGYPLDFPRWQSELRERGPQFPAGERERAAMCLAVLKEYGLSGRPWFPASEMTRLRNMDDLTRHFYETFVPPLVQYLDLQAQQRADGLAPETLLQEVVELVEKRQGGELAGAVEALEQASRDLYASSGAESWRDVARGCRTSLQLLSTSFYRPQSVPVETPEPGAADHAQRLALVVRDLMGAAGYEDEHRYVELKASLAAANWELAERLAQMQSITLEDAKYCLLCTYLTLAEIARLSPTARG